MEENAITAKYFFGWEFLPSVLGRYLVCHSIFIWLSAPDIAQFKYIFLIEVIQDINSRSCFLWEWLGTECGERRIQLIFD